MIKLVVFDLDNVIIDGEGIDEIGKLINIEDQIAAITEQAMQGDIDFETSIKKRVGLLKGVATDDIRTLANEMPLMKGAEETVSTLKENGFDVAIISGSFDIIADTIKGKLDVDNIFTNSLVEEDGILTGEVTGPFNAKPALKENADIIVETRDLTDVLNVIINLNSENTEGDADVDKEVAVETEVVETTDVVVENQEEEQVADATEEVVEEIEETEEVVEEETAEEEAEEAEEEAVEEEVAEAEEEVEDEEAPEAEEEVAEEKPVKEAKPKKSKKKNALPEPDFDLADTIEGVRAQKDEREERIAKVADEREAFNREAKEQRKIRDELNSELKENLAKAIEFRDQRNEINKQVEENKKARNKVNDEIKSLEWSSGKKDKIRIEAEIKKIDKIIETRVLQKSKKTIKSKKKLLNSRKNLKNSTLK